MHVYILYLPQRSLICCFGIRGRSSRLHLPLRILLIICYLRIRGRGSQASSSSARTRMYGPRLNSAMSSDSFAMDLSSSRITSSFDVSSSCKSANGEIEGRCRGIQSYVAKEKGTTPCYKKSRFMHTLEGVHFLSKSHPEENNISSIYSGSLR